MLFSIVVVVICIPIIAWNISFDPTFSPASYMCFFKLVYIRESSSSYNTQNKDCRDTRSNVFITFTFTCPSPNPFSFFPTISFPASQSLLSCFLASFFYVTFQLLTIWAGDIAQCHKHLPIKISLGFDFWNKMKSYLEFGSFMLEKLCNI